MGYIEFIKNIFRKQNYSVNNSYSKTVFIILFFLAFSSWALFYFGMEPVAQSESGLLFYSSHLFEGYKSTWSSFGLGADGTLMLPLKTFIFIYFLNHDSAIDPFFVQYAFYFSLFCLSYLGILLNIKRGYKTLDQQFYYYLPVIYIYNPFSLFILERFQYPFIAFYFLFPLIYYFTYRFLEANSFGQTIRYLVLVNLILLFYSIIYASLVLVILLLLFWFIIFASYALVEYKFNIKGYIKFGFLKCVPFLFLWIALNSFWLIPAYLRLTTPVPFGTGYSSTNDNLGNLIYFSKEQGGWWPILTLINKNFNANLAVKFYLYDNIFYLLAVIPIIIIAWAMLSRRYLSTAREKYSYTVILVGLGFSLLLRALNPPTGFLFKIIFEKLTFFQVFRNPFEKFNLVFVTPYVIAICLAYIYLFNRISFCKLKN